MPVGPRELAATLVARARLARAEDERRAEELRRLTRAEVAELRAAGALQSAWLIGSLAWGGFGPRSDVDLVVRGADASRLGALAADLCARLGQEVDLLRLEDLPASFRERVLAHGWALDEP